MFTKFHKIQVLNIIAFLIVPIISSFISTYHIVDFFELGNFTWMAVLLAVTFELGALASALSITILDKISKTAVWSIFLILVIFQMIGNVYYTFDFINIAEKTNAGWLDTASIFINYWYEFDNVNDMKMFLSILLGIPIPLISLAFLKTLVDYTSNINKETPIDSSDDVVNDIPLPEPIVEDINEPEAFMEVESPIEDEVVFKKDPVPVGEISNDAIANLNSKKKEDDIQVKLDDEKIKNLEQIELELARAKEELEMKYGPDSKDKVISELIRIVEESYPQVYGKNFDADKLKEKYNI